MNGLDWMQEVVGERGRRWHPGGLESWSTMEWAAAVAGEAGELIGAAKNLKRIADGIPGADPADEEALRHQVEDEAADVLSYLLCLAERQGFSLESAFRRKFNEVSARAGFPERL